MVSIYILGKFYWIQILFVLRQHIRTSDSPNLLWLFIKREFCCAIQQYLIMSFWVNIFYFFYYFRRIIRVSPWTVLDMIRYFINLNSTSQGLHLFPRDKVSLGKDLTAMSCFWNKIMLNFIFRQLFVRIIKEWTISNNFLFHYRMSQHFILFLDSWKTFVVLKYCSAFQEPGIENWNVTL